MSVAVMHEDPELVAAVRVQAAQLQVLAVVADLASEPLDVQRAQAMREALDEVDSVRPLLAQMRRASTHRSHLTLLPPVDEEIQ